MLQLILLFTLLLSGEVFAVEIHVTSDRNPVQLDESFTLTYSASAAPDADPDFSLLERDFEILRQSQNNQMSVINGRYQHTREWEVNLMPKRAGNLATPPIPFGSDRSDTLTVTVLAGASAATHRQTDEDVFLEVQADPLTPYVQAQSLYTLRVLSRIDFTGGELSEPAADNILFQRVGEDRRYSTERQGIRYSVIERQYALFPQKSGPLTIPPQILATQVPVGGGGSAFSPFFGRRMQLKRLHSEPVTLTVKPVPDAFKGHPWLPAEQVEIEETWSGNPERLSVGEPVTRTITLRAQAATVGLLPDIMAAETSESHDIKRYPDQPLLNEEKLAAGLLSVRQEKAAYVPSRSGSFTLPAVEVYWWNTRTNRQEVAHLAARTLQVQDTSPAVPPSPATERPAATQTPGENSDRPSVSTAPVQNTPSSPIWIILTAVFATVWIITLLAWWLSYRTRQKPAGDSQPADTKPARTRQAMTALRAACQENDAQQARKALLEWAASQWGDVKYVGLETLASKTGAPLAQDIERLNQLLYGNAETHWEGQTLWANFQRYLQQGTKVNITKNPDLEPLYRGQ